MNSLCTVSFHRFTVCREPWNVRSLSYVLKIMDQTSFSSHLSFYMPSCDLCSTQTLKFSPELMKIFYIARVVFSEASQHRIKTQAAPLFNRERVFAGGRDQDNESLEPQQPARMDNNIALAQIRSVSDITHLLPREHIIYPDNIFYKKVANRELIKIDYEGGAAAVASVDDFLNEQEVELRRSQKVYLLFDNSTSMNGENFKKLLVSKAIAIEYLRRAAPEEPQLYFRSFHSEVSDLVKASTCAGIETLVGHITRLGTGGGQITNIGEAIVQAIADIRADVELRQAEILVMTDGFGPVPDDLLEQLGSIKLHILLIPDLDIEKILQLYPDRKAWKKGGHDGTRPMPPFWQYYGDKAPPAVLYGDDLFKDQVRSSDTAAKSVKELKMLEILQGLNQIYALQEVCENFIFVVITSILEDPFPFTASELEAIRSEAQRLNELAIDQLSNDEKMKALQQVNFLIQFLEVARNNTQEGGLKKGIRAVEKILRVVQARILDDPWIRSVIKVDDISIDFQFDMAAQRKKDDSEGMLAAFIALVKILRDKVRYFFGQLRNDYRI